MNKFLIIATLCSFLLVAIVLSVGFKSFGNMTHGNNSSAIEIYGRKALATIKGVAKPVLKEFGVDANSISVNPTDRVKHELEKAGEAVNEATKNLTQ